MREYEDIPYWEEASFEELANNLVAKINENAICKKIYKFQENSYHLKGCKELLFECVPHLIAIKEELGGKSKLYVNTSTLLANILLDFIVKECNEYIGGNISEKIKQDEEDTLIPIMWTLRFAWNIISNIERLATTEEFKKNRLKGNRDTLIELIELLDPSFAYSAYTLTKKMSYKMMTRRLTMTLGLPCSNFIRNYITTWCCDTKNLFPLLRNQYSFSDTDIFGRKLPFTYGFMSGHEDEEFINLKSETDYFCDCKETFEKKKVREKNPYNYEYDYYLEKFPKGKYIKEVKHFKEVSQHEHDLFVYHSNDISKCREYLAKFPEGWYAEQIENQIDDFIFNNYESRHKIKHYLRKYPDGKNAGKARMIIEQRRRKVLIGILCALVPTLVIGIFILLEWSIVFGSILAVLSVFIMYFGYLVED